MTNEEVHATLKLAKKYLRLMEIDFDDFGDNETGEITIKNVPSEIHATLYKKILELIGDMQAAALAEYETELSKWGSQK